METLDALEAQIKANAEIVDAVEPQCPTCLDFRENRILTGCEDPFHDGIMPPQKVPTRNELRVMRKMLTRVKRDKAGLPRYR